MFFSGNLNLLIYYCPYFSIELLHSNSNPGVVYSHLLIIIIDILVNLFTFNLALGSNRYYLKNSKKSKDFLICKW